MALIVSSQESSRDFYLRVLGPLGFRLADELPGRYARLSNDIDSTIVLSQVSPEFAAAGHHRRRVGLHHFALRVGSDAIVDRTAALLTQLGVPCRGTGAVETGYRGQYYTLAFEDPDGILIEIVAHSESYFAAAAD